MNSPIKKWAEDLNGFLKKEKDNTHMKRCLLLIIREMQVKTTMRYDLRAVRLAFIEKQTKHKK